ncbi:hypothetical protein [Burkholderia ambifaria]|uniref:hypothetical protein n=1 Tax=Burkholderia ambifaria TaxID=152480 RepID=UPI00158AC3FC
MFVVQHQHALDHHLLVVEQQAGMIVLDPIDTRVKRSLRPAIWLDIFARRGLSPHEVREVNDPDQATNLVEITAPGANRRQGEMVFQRARAYLGGRGNNISFVRACRSVWDEACFLIDQNCTLLQPARRRRAKEFNAPRPPLWMIGKTMPISARRLTSSRENDA